MVPTQAGGTYLGMLAANLGPGFRIWRLRDRPLLPSADIVHVHWPENLFNEISPREALRARIRRWLVFHAIRRVRRRGALVWTVHNFARHEPMSPRHARQAGYWLRRFRAQVDIAIAMDAAQLPELQRRFPEIPATRWRVIPHPHYREAFAERDTRAQTRAALGIGETTTLVSMIGNARPYKGIIEAIAAFRATAGDRALLIAGIPGEDGFAAHIRAEAARDPRIHLIARQLTDREVASFYAASDLALLNYTTEMLNSGSIFAALSLDCPVLAPRQPSFAPLAAGNPGWIELFDGPLDAGILGRAIARRAAPRPATAPDLSGREPDIFGALHRQLYAEALEIAAARRSR